MIAAVFPGRLYTACITNKILDVFLFLGILCSSLSCLQRDRGQPCSWLLRARGSWGALFLAPLSSGRSSCPSIRHSPRHPFLRNFPLLRQLPQCLIFPLWSWELLLWEAWMEQSWQHCARAAQGIPWADESMTWILLPMKPEC